MMLFLVSCTNNSPSDNSPVEKSKNTTTFEFNSNHNIDRKLIYKEIIYHFSEDDSIKIINSFPKGVTDYTDSMDKKWSYVVFFSEFENYSTKPFKLKIDFPNSTNYLLQNQQVQLKLFFPKEKLNISKLREFDYGLKQITSELENHFFNNTHIEITFKPHESQLIPVIVLTDKRINGVIRAGFSLKNKRINYLVNEKIVSVGEIVQKD